MSHAPILRQTLYLLSLDEAARAAPFVNREQVEALVSLLRVREEKTDPLKAWLNPDVTQMRFQIKVRDVGAQATMGFIRDLEDKLDEELAERADNAALDVDQPVETEPEHAAELLVDASELPASDTNDDEQTAPDSSAEPNAEPEPVGEAPDESAAAFAASDPPAPEVEEAWPDLDAEPQSNDETAAQAEAETPPAPEPEPAPAANAEPDTKSKPEPKPTAKPPTPAKAPKPSKASKPSKPGKTAQPAKAAKPVKAASLQPAAATSTSDKAGSRSIKQLGPWIIAKAKDRTPKVTAWFIATGRRLAPKLAPAALTTSRAISKPLERKPKALRDMIGWVALGSLFWGGCVWVVVLFFREPVIPQAATPPAALITPEAVPGPTPGTTPMPSASGVSLGE